MRFQPVKFVRSKALRVEVYGVLISRGILFFIRYHQIFIFCNFKAGMMVNLAFSLFGCWM